MPKTKAFVFDLDDTLAESKQPIPIQIAYQLSLLTKKYRVAILTGGQYKQVEKQVLQQLHESINKRIDILACSGSQYRINNGNIITDMIPAQQRERIKNLVEKVAIEQGVWCGNPVGPIIEDRLAQITFSALGQEASPQAKSGWDVDKRKRQNLVERLQNLVDGFDFRIGGSTSIDVTPVGRDKAYGMNRYLNLVQITPFETVYVGDSFTNSGNDFPVIATGVHCIEVSGWEHTLQFLKLVNGEQVS